MSNVLVTGGSGFLGRSLVTALRERGHAVRVFDRAASDGWPDGVAFEQGSILDAAALARTMIGIDEVYHLAAIPNLWAHPKSSFETVNGEGTERVMAAAADAGVRRVLHCSTEAVLMPRVRTAGMVDETRLPPLEDMSGPYTRSKHRAERAALAAAKRGLDVVIVNPTVPVGAGDFNLTPPAAMLSLFLAGGSPAFLDCVLNLVDVDDVAAGMVLARERGRSGERYILGGENIALRDLLAKLQRLSGRRMPRVAIPAPVAFASAAVAEWIADRVTHRPPVATREGVRLAMRSAPLDGRKARDELGFAPKPIDEALAQAVRWLSAAATSK